jgi:hypothetical protein
LLSAISKSAKCNVREAAECLLQELYRKNEGAFTSVALEKGLITDGKKKWMQCKLRP